MEEKIENLLKEMNIEYRFVAGDFVFYKNDKKHSISVPELQFKFYDEDHGYCIESHYDSLDFDLFLKRIIEVLSTDPYEEFKIRMLNRSKIDSNS